MPHSTSGHLAHPTARTPTLPPVAGRLLTSPAASPPPQPVVLQHTGGTPRSVMTTHPHLPNQSRELAMVLRSTPPPPPADLVILSSPPACPTCHRPWDYGPQDAPAAERHTHGGPYLSPQYFRALGATRTQLAIGDGSTTYATASIPSKPAGHRRFSSARSARNVELEPLPVVPEPRVSDGSEAPMWSYVSPTGPNPRTFHPHSKSPTSPLKLTLETENEENVEESSPGRSATAIRVSNDETNEESSGVCASQSLGGIHNGYYHRYFVEVQKLGSGTYGGVYLCHHIMESVRLGTFALKKIPVGDNVTYLQNVLREVRILEEVKRHPNVVEYNHSWVETAQLADFGPPVRCLFVLMEYATEGALDSYLERFGTALSTVAVWYFFLSAVAGTAHLHGKNILHRDLKPQNLLLTGPPGKPPRVLVSDFGTAALLGDVSYNRTGGTGTLEYMAPELLECAPNMRHETYLNHHSKVSDVWSLGMILHYLACGTALPSSAPDGSVNLDIQASSPYPRPPEMVELIRAMLQRDPKRRPSCVDILKSTVAQTIMKGFNHPNGLYTDDVHQPNTTDVFQTQRFYEPSVEVSEHLRAVGPSTTNTDALQSSRVELMSATATVMDVPLLTQYRSQDATLRAEVGSPNLSGTRKTWRPPVASVSSPTRRAPHCVDAGVQTDPVTFVE